MNKFFLFVVLLTSGCNLPFHFTEEKETVCPYYSVIHEEAEKQEIEKLEMAYKVFSGASEFVDSFTEEELSELTISGFLDILEEVQQELGINESESVFKEEFREIMVKNGLEEPNIQSAKLNEEVSFQGEKFKPIDRLSEILDCFENTLKNTIMEK